MPRLRFQFEEESLARRESIPLAELRCWRAWELGRSRCPYCVGAEDYDWLAMCDCFYDEEKKERLWAAVPTPYLQAVNIEVMKSTKRDER